MNHWFRRKKKLEDPELGGGTCLKLSKLGGEKCGESKRSLGKVGP